MVWNADVPVFTDARTNKRTSEEAADCAQGFSVDGFVVYFQTHKVWLVVSAVSLLIPVLFFFGEVQVDWEKQDMPMVSRRILVTKPEINGKKLGMLNFRSMYNVNITRVNRSGVDLFANPNLILQVGDRVMVVGSEDAVERVASVLALRVR